MTIAFFTNKNYNNPYFQSTYRQIDNKHGKKVALLSMVALEAIAMVGTAISIKAKSLAVLAFAPLIPLYSVMITLIYFLKSKKPQLENHKEAIGYLFKALQMTTSITTLFLIHNSSLPIFLFSLLTIGTNEIGCYTQFKQPVKIKQD